MISIAMYSVESKELKVIKKLWEMGIAVSSDENLLIESFTDVNMLEKFLRSNLYTDILCFDINTDDGIERVTQIRKGNKNISIILIVSAKISPLKYMKPSIMASALIMRPIDNDQVNEVISGILFEMKRVDSDNNGVLKIKQPEGTVRIAYDDIYFFEAREKRVFVNTLSHEFAFYDTLDSLLDRLPDNFARCHKSYIVNKSTIVRVSLSRNEIELREKRFVPLSRTYKKDFK